MLLEPVLADQLTKRYTVAASLTDLGDSPFGLQLSIAAEADFGLLAP